MRKLASAVGYAAMAGICIVSCQPKVSVPAATAARLQAYLSARIGDQLARENVADRVPLTVAVDAVRIVRITAGENAQDYRYQVRGTVTYHRSGPSHWKDRFGNDIHADTAGAVTRWFSCGVLEDRAIHVFFDDIDNRLILYADQPAD